MPRPWANLIVLVASAIGALGCQRSVPNVVTTDEYRVYSSYLRHYASTRKKQQEILVMNRTFPASAMFGKYVASSRCAASSNGLLKELLAFGDAQYPLLNTGETSVVVPFSYRMVTADGSANQKAATSGYYSVQYTRVAFNRTRTEAFFGVATDVCYSTEGRSSYPVECGYGATWFIHARKSGVNEWSFEDAKDCPRAIE